ncbi:MAG: CRISPR-associated helicase/endonuclease Cas3 [Saprospiraceae bacterium]|nr:MAG: CRISPR-associated helicase/endonuclease Cas3 [Saprospiraceae bacterium]
MLSHTDRTLKEHLDSCYQIGLKVLENKRVSKKLIAKKDLLRLFRQLVYFHDFGKATDFFQYRIIEATKKDNPLYVKQHQGYFDFFAEEKAINARQELEKDSRFGRHAMLGAYFQTAHYGREDLIEELILFKVIKKHHGNLTNFTYSDKNEITLDEESLELLEKQLDHLDFSLYSKILPEGISISSEDWSKVKFKYKDILLPEEANDRLEEVNTLRYFFLQHYLFSLLLSADKGDVMTQNKSIIRSNRIFPTNLVGAYKKHTFCNQAIKSIDLAREEAYQAIGGNAKQFYKEHFFSITLPTGMGKTFSAYNAAIQLQNLSKGNPRIVYCLPFTSVIDQNVQVLAEIFEYNGEDLTHISKNHHLSNPKENYNNFELADQEGEYLTDGWEHDFIITTFIQLTEGIFNNRNKRLRKFHNLTDSILILDEVQNIPPKYYEAIEATFRKLADYFGTKFIFVTATQPLLMPNTNVIELTDPNFKKTETYFRQLNRIQIDKSLLNAGANEDIRYWISKFKEDIEQQPEKSFLLILNTIKSSQNVFEALRCFQNKNCDLFYLSSSILPCFRKEIINQIKQSKKRKIVVSTQVVEAGVDIDLDLVYRDFAPLDSINQSAGRCNRNGINGKGTVKLFNSGKAKMIYDETNLDITVSVLNQFPDIIQESILYDLNILYFNEVKRKIQDDSTASDNILKHMKLLQLEDLADEFRLIDKSYPTYNVFIPFQKADVKHLSYFDFDKISPFKVWEQYQQIFEDFQNRFDRKREIKKMRAEIMQFVAKFPASKYTPPEGQEEKIIIFDEAWAMNYDLETGFKSTDDQTVIF